MADRDPLDLDCDLENPDEVGIISLWDGGRKITRQIAGHHCLRPVLEGGYIALRPSSNELQHHFGHMGKWGTWCLGIDEETADFISSCIAQWGLADIVKLSRPISGSDATVNVEIIDRLPHWPDEIRLGPGVLTWPNSD